MTQKDRDDLIVYRLDALLEEQKAQGTQLETLNTRTSEMKIDIARLQERGGWGKIIASTIATGLLLFGGLVLAYVKGVFG